MSRVYTHAQDPFVGLAESIVTSATIDTRYAFDVTVSWRTTSGTTSINTYQLSNDPARNFESITEATWSHWTTYGTIGGFSGSTTFDPPLGFRWARILRENSGATFDVDINVLFR